MNPLVRLKYLLLLPVLLSCSNSITESVLDDVLGQKIFFEVEYINHAWGYAHMGIHIGDSGDIYSYRYDPSNPEDQWLPNQDGVYTEKKLFEKFDHQKLFVRTIDEKELIHMIILISSANKGGLSQPVSTANDFGIWSFKTYTYDNAVKKYTEVILRVEGDWFAENKTWQASIIALWLEAQKAYWLESFK